MGTPGTLLAGWAVELPYFGRRGTLAASAGEYSSSHDIANDLNDCKSQCLRGHSFSRVPQRALPRLCLGGTVRTRLATPYVLPKYVFCSIRDVGCSQIMYSVLWAVSPELFPAKDRGTGNGLVFTATNLFGVLVRFYCPFCLVGSYFGLCCAGSSDCALCKPQHRSASLYRGRAHDRHRRAYTSATIRAPRQGVHLNGDIRIKTRQGKVAMS